MTETQEHPFSSTRELPMLVRAAVHDLYSSCVFPPSEEGRGIAQGKGWLLTRGVGRQYVGMGILDCAGYLHTVCTRPEYEGQGHASAIAELACAVALRGGLPAVWLVAAPGRDGFWCRRGWRPMNDRPHYMIKDTLCLPSSSPAPVAGMRT